MSSLINDPAGESPPRVGLFLNDSAQGAQHAKCAVLREQLAARLPSGAILSDHSEGKGTLTENLALAASDCRLLIAGGGDGTIAAAVQACRDHDCTLAILPLGTMNVFARSLGLPLDAVDAIDVAFGGERRRVDYGDVNGRVFLNGVILGLFSELAEERERLRSAGIRSIWQVLRQAVHTFVSARAHRYRLISSERQLDLRSRVVAVINNRLADSTGDPFARTALDASLLDIYASRDPSLLALPKMLLRMLMGRPRPDTTLARWESEAVRIHTRRRSLKVSVDGEVVTMTTPLRCVIRPGGLRVMVPADSASNPSARALDDACDADEQSRRPADAAGTVERSQ